MWKGLVVGLVEGVGMRLEGRRLGGGGILIFWAFGPLGGFGLVGVCEGLGRWWLAVGWLLRLGL